MKKELEVIAEINGVKFYKGNIIDNGNKKELLIFTDDENFRIDIDENINKAIKRIYDNYYAWNIELMVNFERWKILWK